MPFDICWEASSWKTIHYRIFKDADSYKRQEVAIPRYEIQF